MSSAKKCPVADCTPHSRSHSQMPRPSTDGATTIPFDSSTLCSTGNSSETATSYGASMTDQPKVQQASPANGSARVDYLDRIGGICELISQASEQSAVQLLLRKGSDVLGAESAVFLSFVRDEAGYAACCFMLACDPAWCREYLRAGMVEHDPWLLYAARHSEPILATDLNVTEPDRQRAVDLASKCGFADAVLVPAHSGACHSRVGLLCLGSSTQGHFAALGFRRLKLGARALSCELHEWWLSHLRRELLLKARITADDLALLRHQCLGHSSKQIAIELNVSKGSINSRFQRMNAKLGVRNRRMALRLATECGVLTE